MSINANSGLFGGNITLSKAGLTGISGGATTYSTGATAITYAVGGTIPATKGQVSGGTTPTTDVITGKAFKPILANQGCVFVWTLDASGNVGVAQGSLPVSPTTTGTQTNVDDSGNYTLLPQFPQLSDLLTPFAYTVVRASSSYAGTGFLFGSANWNTTGITCSTNDVFTLPAVPKTS